MECVLKVCHSCLNPGAVVGDEHPQQRLPGIGKIDRAGKIVGILPHRVLGIRPAEAFKQKKSLLRMPSTEHPHRKLDIGFSLRAKEGLVLRLSDTGDPDERSLGQMAHQRNYGDKQKCRRPQEGKGKRAPEPGAMYRTDLGP